MFSRTFRSGSILVLILALAAVTPAAALEVSLTSEDVTLIIGESLSVTRDGLVPDRLYRAAVTDEAGGLVAETLFKPDPDGVLGPAVVWIGTGLVGCDLDADPAPGEYRFARLEEAEDLLKSRTFDLTILDDATQTSVARIPLRLAARETNLFYFSDSDGCPRCRYGVDEPVFLSGSRVTLNSFWMFLIEATEEPLEAGDPLDEVREEPQKINPSSSYFTERVADALAPGAGYKGAYEPSDADDAEPPDVLTPTGVELVPWACHQPCPKPSYLIKPEEPEKIECGPKP